MVLAAAGEELILGVWVLRPVGASVFPVDAHLVGALPLVLRVGVPVLAASFPAAPFPGGAFHRAGARQEVAPWAVLQGASPVAALVAVASLVVELQLPVGPCRGGAARLAAARPLRPRACPAEVACRGAPRADVEELAVLVVARHRGGEELPVVSFPVAIPGAAAFPEEERWGAWHPVARLPVATLRVDEFPAAVARGKLDRRELDWEAELRRAFPAVAAYPAGLLVELLGGPLELAPNLVATVQGLELAPPQPPGARVSDRVSLMCHLRRPWRFAPHLSDYHVVRSAPILSVPRFLCRLPASPSWLRGIL